MLLTTPNEVTQFADALTVLIRSCNAYLRNQTDDHAEQALRQATALIQRFSETIHIDIAHLRTTLVSILNSPAPDAEKIEALRQAADIIEPENLVLIPPSATSGS